MRCKIKTMEELSHTIGVSRPTLSRYFQDPGSVRASTCEKIRSGLERVDYVPNFFATRLNRKTTGLIGVVSPHLNDLFYTSLLEVIQRAAGASGFTVVIQSSCGTAKTEADAIEKLMSMSADGVIVAPMGESSSLPVLERLQRSLPCIFLDSRLPDDLPQVDFVGTNNKQSIALITDYLCRTGEALFFLECPGSIPMLRNVRRPILSRWKHKLQATVIDSGSVPEGWELENYAHEVMDRHFGRGHFHDRTTLCANDRLAIGAIRAANRHRLHNRGPGGGPGFRIAGHDDHPLSRFMSPSLTTVTQDIEAIGTEAIRLLTGRINGRRTDDDRPRIKTFDVVFTVKRVRLNWTSGPRLIAVKARSD